ncbi:MAG: hypothetical protein ABIG42_02345, partial [bacterium]
AALKKETLEQFPISEKIQSAEDRELRNRLVLAGNKVVYNPKANVIHAHHYTTRRRFTLGLRRGHSHNWQALLKPKVQDVRSAALYSVLVIPRVIKRSITSIVADSRYLRQRKEGWIWYFRSIPYNVIFILGYYIGPLWYYNYGKK